MVDNALVAFYREPNSGVFLDKLFSTWKKCSFIKGPE